MCVIYKIYNIQYVHYCSNLPQHSATNVDLIDPFAPSFCLILLRKFLFRMEYIDKSFPILALLGSVAVCSFLQRKNKPSNNPDVTISELWIYPIKSCKGIRVDRAEITPRGFDLDRLFMLADSTGKFVSQRSYPTMALIDVQVGTFEGAKLGVTYFTNNFSLSAF